MACRLADFAGRLLRFDPAALIRIRLESTGSGCQLWAELPWQVLVSCTSTDQIAADQLGSADLTVTAASVVTPPWVRADAQWRGALPSAAVSVAETIPAAEIRRTAAAAAQTLRAMRGRTGERAIRDALLNHPVIAGTSDHDDTEFVIPQRVVQAVVRMGFLARHEPNELNEPVELEQPVRVITAGRWVGLAASGGTAWLRPAGLLAAAPFAS